MATYTNTQQLLSIQQVEQSAISDLAYELGIAVTFGDTVLPIAPFVAIGFAIADLISAFSGGRPVDQDTNNVIGAYNMSAYWPLHSLAANLASALKNGAPISDSRPEIQAEFSQWKLGTIESIQGLAGVETGSAGPGFWQLQQLIDASWAWSQDGEAKVLDVVKAIDELTIQLSLFAQQKPAPPPPAPAPQPTPTKPAPPPTPQPTPTQPTPPSTPSQPMPPLSPQSTRTQPTPPPPPPPPPPTPPPEQPTAPATPAGLPSWPWGTIPDPCIPDDSGEGNQLGELSICLNENLSALAYIAWLMYQALSAVTSGAGAGSTPPPTSDGGAGAAQCCANLVKAINQIPIAIASAIAQNAPGSAAAPVNLSAIVAALTALNQTIAAFEECVCPPLKQIADSVSEADALAAAVVAHWATIFPGDPGTTQLVVS